MNTNNNNNITFFLMFSIIAANTSDRNPDTASCARSILSCFNEADYELLTQEGYTDNKGKPTNKAFGLGIKTIKSITSGSQDFISLLKSLNPQGISRMFITSGSMLMAMDKKGRNIEGVYTPGNNLPYALGKITENSVLVDKELKSTSEINPKFYADYDVEFANQQISKALGKSVEEKVEKKKTTKKAVERNTPMKGMFTETA